jgi:hypothetical protein
VRAARLPRAAAAPAEGAPDAKSMKLQLEEDKKARRRSGTPPGGAPGIAR